MTTEKMKHSLLERLTAWVQLFEKREDVTFSERAFSVTPCDSDAPLPDPKLLPADAVEMAKQVSSVEFSYRTRSRLDGFGGFLYLDLTGTTVEASITADEHEYQEAVELDCDREGTGSATFYLHAAPRPFILYGIDDRRRFDSLEDYLTAGARNAFCYAPSWQMGETKPSPLFELSASRSLRKTELIARLIERGATPQMAADLHEWLGSDVVLLLPQTQRSELPLSMGAQARQKVSSGCLRGKPVPKSLQAVWARHQAKDAFLERWLQIDELLTDANAIADRFADPQSLLEKFAPFATTKDGDVLAFWRAGPWPEPPVAKLSDSCEWLGRSLTEVILNGSGPEDEKRQWVATYVDEPFRVAEKFYPCFFDLLAPAPGEEAVKPKVFAAAAKPANSEDPATWVLRPADEVKLVIEDKFGRRALAKAYLQCTSEGLIDRVQVDEWLHGAAVLGITLGMPRAEAEAKARPTQSSDDEFSFVRENLLFKVRFDEQVVSSVGIFADLDA